MPVQCECSPFGTRKRRREPIYGKEIDRQHCVGCQRATGLASMTKLHPDYVLFFLMLPRTGLCSAFLEARQRCGILPPVLFAELGDRVLDIGCGPAQILNFMRRVEYIGYDPNARYINDARKNYDPEFAQFFIGHFEKSDLALHQPFDIGLLLGVLHHLDDEEASSIIALMRLAIKPGGRLVTLDNVFIDHQNPIARKLIEWDRGKNVRTPGEYRAMADKHFGLISETVIHKSFPPYTLYVMECS